MSTTGWVVLGVVVVLVLWIIMIYNQLVAMRQRVGQSFSDIDVQLKQRLDLIPNLVETVKGYASHEKEALERVVQARAAATSAHGLEQVAAADGMLTQALRGLLAVSEAYPDLKASANFLSLQEELSATENKVGFARQYYNDSVRTLNATVVAIPGKFFAGLAKVTARTFYEVNDPQARTVPKVQF